MQDQWEAAHAGLRVFLDEDGEYVRFLKSLEDDFALKLRFCGGHSRGGVLVESVDLWRFLDGAAQLRCLHVLFQGKLKDVANAPDSGDATSASLRCTSLVQALADMLSVVRVCYGQLFSRREVVQAMLERASTADKKKQKAWDCKLLAEYLKSQHLTGDELIARALNRFNELIEFVEALSAAFKSSVGDDGDNRDSEHNCAPRLMHIAQENRHYMHLIQTEAREELELIALQKQFRGDRASLLSDLSGSKLLVQGAVVLSVLGDRQPSSAGAQTDSTASMAVAPSERLYMHCFQDGTLVCSKKQGTKPAGTLTIRHYLKLKQEPIFFEPLPDSVAVEASIDKAGAFALITRDSALVFAVEDEVAKQQWVDVIGGFLETNESRGDALRKERAVDDLPIPHEISQQGADSGSPLTAFTSFHDDHLAGVFWMATEIRGSARSSGRSKQKWALVELVFRGRWLLVFELNGWKGHTLLQSFDTSTPQLEIAETPRGEKEWSLVVSGAGAVTITLVSKKRTRIDFWVDQMWKAIDSAQTTAKRTKAEAREQQAMQEEEEAQASGHARKRREEASHVEIEKPFINSRKKKRKLNTVAPADEHGRRSSRGSDKTDEEEGDTAKSGASTLRPTAESGEQPTIRVAGRKSARMTKKEVTSTRPEIVPIQTAKPVVAAPSPAVKTPKRRWLKRKSDDPDDTALLATQPSPSIPTDEATSEVDSTQGSESTGGVEQPVRIILTGIELSATIRKKIDAVANAVYEEDIEKATHLVAPKNQLKRTVKLLCGISCCAHILDVGWLDESARVGAPIYERAHCLEDAKAEAKWQFDLKKTMYDFTAAQRRQLFAGHHVFITNHKSVLPPVVDLVKIVECAGGKAETEGNAGPSDLVITSEAALAVASVRKAVAQANPQRIYSPELILTSILQQHIDFEKHHLALTSGGRRRK
ncbi:hypothetical protein BBJ28_00022528 [Nothophytophthora sp. Chile5]|nr:hypothetical protein BBJ28_00022528 [Nothophytophthora sp. Chile5]